MRQISRKIAETANLGAEGTMAVSMVRSSAIIFSLKRK
jgi:hypothetical protein